LVEKFRRPGQQPTYVIQTNGTLLDDEWSDFLATNHFLVEQHNGDIYNCDHYVEPDYLIGNVVSKPLQDAIQYPAQRDFGTAKRIGLPAQCCQCSVRWACHGGCPKDRFATTATGKPGLNYLCAGYFSFFTHADPTMRQLGQLLDSGRPAADIMRATPEFPGSEVTHPESIAGYAR
jgi:radical SAM protein with 4Fe4S-binding SPASM domain